MTLAEAAQRLAAEGWPVFPLKPRGKVPLTSAGFRDASAEASRVTRWWRSHPDANIGLAIPIGMVVVDQDGETTLDLPPTLTAKTARGYHFFYKLPKNVTPIQRVGISEHVDLRVGGKGYVVAPPSIHETGTVYEWVDESADIAEAPSWIFAGGPRTTQEARSANLEADIITQGNRNATLTQMAGRMRGIGLHPNVVHAALAKVNEQQVDPPLSPDEVARIAMSSATWMTNEPVDIRRSKKAKELEPFVVLSDVDPSDPQPLLLGRLDPLDHTILFGDGGTGKGVVAAWWIAQLTLCGHRIAIFDYEQHARYEWRPRIEAFGGDLSKVFIVQPKHALWDEAEQRSEEMAELGITYAVIDSIGYACLGQEVEKSSTATLYSLAIATLAVPVLSLAHTTKNDADPRHPFGSVFWSNGARITIGLFGRGRDPRILSNKKTNQRAPFDDVSFDWSWIDIGLPRTLTETAGKAASTTDDVRLAMIPTEEPGLSKDEIGLLWQIDSNPFLLATLKRLVEADRLRFYLVPTGRGGSDKKMYLRKEISVHRS